MKRFSISILSHWQIGILFIASLFFSCAKDDGQTEQPGSTTTGRTIRKELSLQTIPFDVSEGEGITRTTTQVPLTEEEKKIHNLWVLQFGGTEPGSLLIKKTAVDVSEINSTTGAFYFDFEELAGGGDSKVYLAVNCESDLPTLTVNTTTLGEFESDIVQTSSWTEDEMKSNGLPMLASQSFDVAAANPAPFKLKSLLAKVVFSFDTTTDFPFKSGRLFFSNTSRFAIPVMEHTPGAAAWHPAGMDFTYVDNEIEDSEYTGEPFTVYLSENLAGQMSAITKDSDRGGKEGTDVPSDAMYVEIGTYGLQDIDILGHITYKFYLGDGTPQDFNVVRHHQYNVHVTLRGASATDKRVYLETANCYLITAPGTYAFLATVMGNGAVTPAAGTNAPEILPTALRPASVKVLWEQSDPTGVANAAGDVVKSVSLSSDGLYINFTTGTKAGNAVIGAFDDAGTLIWSWHIWRPESNPDDVACHTTDNGGRDFTMMGLNLGAFNNNVNDVKAYGLLYQWGRKDPFPGATGTNTSDSGSATFGGVISENGYSFAAVSGAVTAQAAIQTPMNFYYNGSGNKDWVSTQQDNLWGNPYTKSGSPNPDLGSKSIYDPCPSGYRVAPQDTWSQATTSNWTTNGQNLKVGTGGATYFYPAAGRRGGDSNAGKLTVVGSNGYYWSSSPNSIGDSNGGYLTFSSVLVRPKSNIYRASGMSVRCMKEE